MLKSQTLFRDLFMITKYHKESLFSKSNKRKLSLNPCESFDTIYLVVFIHPLDLRRHFHPKISAESPSVLLQPKMSYFYTSTNEYMYLDIMVDTYVCL